MENHHVYWIIRYKWISIAIFTSYVSHYQRVPIGRRSVEDVGLADLFHLWPQGRAGCMKKRRREVLPHCDHGFFNTEIIPKRTIQDSELLKLTQIIDTFFGFC